MGRHSQFRIGTPPVDLFAGVRSHGLKLIESLSEEELATSWFAVGDVVLVDGVARGRVRGVHRTTAEVSVRLDEDNNLHRLKVGRVSALG